MNKTIIESVREFVKKCPYLDEFTNINVDFLSPNDGGYSIDEQPTETILTRYIDGSTERQFVFAFSARFAWNQERENNINNSGFFEHFQQWLEECTENDDLPDMPDGMTPFSIKATSSGYLYGIENSQRYAKYQCQCQLIYDKE